MTMTMEGIIMARSRRRMAHAQSSPPAPARKLLLAMARWTKEVERATRQGGATAREAAALQGEASSSGKTNIDD
jgi:hypothetical protein